MIKTRRQLLVAGATAVAACLFADRDLPAQTNPATRQATSQPAEPIIDIHQHTTYSGRSNIVMVHHQFRMGIAKTILLPGGSPVITESTLKGRANGLYAGAGTVDTCIEIARIFPGSYYFGANEVPDLPEARERIEKALTEGAVCIGEQKFNLPVDSAPMEMIYAIANEHQVPILMHFQYQTFNTGFERFGKVLEKWPKVNFIAHAQTFWANIDAGYTDQKNLYPKGKISPGGMSDRYLSDYPNFFGDLSAGSGLNALTRDEEHARGFLDRHQDKLIYGSDCSDHAGFGPTCSGAGMISAIRRLSPDKKAERKFLFENANKMFKLR
jgi:predicted TIM-barrel fold metal-dependent hydrolase